MPQPRIIIGIFLHNYCHWLGSIIKENEYQYFQHNVDWLNQVMVSMDPYDFNKNASEYYKGSENKLALYFTHDWDVIVVAQHHAVALDADLAGLVQFILNVVVGLAHGTHLLFDLCEVQDAVAEGLGHSVALVDDEAVLGQLQQHPGVEGSGRAAQVPQAVQTAVPPYPCQKSWHYITGEAYPTQAGHSIGIIHR